MNTQTTALNGLRETAATWGSHVLRDAEFLTLLLARSEPADPAKLAAKLLARFGSIGAVLASPFEQLASIGGAAVASDLGLVQGGLVRVLGETTRKRDIITSWQQLLDYVRVNIQHEAREQFRVLFLDKKNQLIADELMGTGTIDHAPVYPREVVKRALELAAASIILVHNHPSGDPTPSQADIDMTRQVIEAGRILKIRVHDHLVIGRDGVSSFRSLGFM